MLSEQNARHAANIPVSFTLDLKQKGISFYIYCKIICKLVRASPSSSFKELFLTCHTYNKFFLSVYNDGVTSLPRLFSVALLLMGRR